MSEEYSIVDVPTTEDDMPVTTEPPPLCEIGTAQLNKKLWKVNGGLLVELANEREAKRKIEMENASLKKEIDDLRALLHPFADDVDLKTSSVPVQTDQLVTPLAAIDEVIEKFSMIHREAQSHLSDGWDSEITLDSNVCDLVQHSLLELSRCKQSMQSLNEALVKTTDKTMTDSHSEETVNQEAKEFSSVAVNTEVEELDQLSPCESFSSVTSVPHETSNQLVAPSAPPADSMGFEWTESTTSTHVGFEGPKVVVPPIIKTPITSTDQSNINMNDSLSIAENVPMQTDEMMEKRVCPVCNAEYSAHLQPEFEAHVENHFAQQQEQSDLAVAAAMNEETTSGSQDHRECPFCQLYFSKDNQDIFEKHVYSHMGFYPPLSSNQ